MCKPKVEDIVSLEAVQMLHSMMMGKSLPEGMIMPTQPKLSDDSAFSVIWYLQEHLRIIPACYELCSGCREIYDADYEGRHIDEDDGELFKDLVGNNYCGACWDTVACDRDVEN